MTDQFTGPPSIPWTKTTGTFPRSRGELGLSSVPSTWTTRSSSVPAGKREGRDVDARRAERQDGSPRGPSPPAPCGDHWEGCESGRPEDCGPPPAGRELAIGAAAGASGVISTS